VKEMTILPSRAEALNLATSKFFKNGVLSGAELGVCFPMDSAENIFQQIFIILKFEKPQEREVVKKSCGERV
jgi:hypothetical protein